jgi:chromosome segregation ATPase
LGNAPGTQGAQPAIDLGLHPGLGWRDAGGSAQEKPEKPVTEATFFAAMEKLHAKMDAGFSVMRQDIGELRQDVAEIRSDVAVLKQDVGVLKQDVGVLKQDVGVLKQDVAVLKEDMTGVKDAALKHTRELSALRTSLATKVDREDVEPMVERVIARHVRLTGDPE